MAYGTEHDDNLSRQALSLWAKTGGRDMPNLWGCLAVHLADTAAMAQILWNSWLAESTRRFVCESAQLQNSDIEVLVAFLAANHDVGKATPSFEAKVPQLADQVRETGLGFSLPVDTISHAYLGAFILRRWLIENGWDELLAEGYASVIGGHHGTCPTEDDLDTIGHRSHINPLGSVGDDEWCAVQDELLDWAYARTGVEQVRVRLQSKLLPTHVQIILNGLIIMADWIASNTDLFPLEERYGGWEYCRSRAEQAWSILRLPISLSVKPTDSSAENVFHARFPHIPADAHLTPVQSVAIEAAQEILEPSLIIIEGQMGKGKTEAAYLVTELCMQKFGCNGVAFLLPTQATSNAMFARAQSWMRHMLAEQGEATWQDLHLLHGKAALNADYASLPSWGVSWMGDGPSEDEAIIAHQWFSGNKRCLLAPFVVGTVDQLLMAALNTRHAQLRHLGLVGKVVVIDEIHAYDAYMSEYLKRVLEFLGKYQVPVVLLSATLPPSRREELLKAYRGQLRPGSLRASVLSDPPRLPSGDPAYPLVSWSGSRPRTELRYLAPQDADDAQTVHIDFIVDDEEALVGELENALAEGGCACVLRDTVRRAQETYQLLKERLNVEVRLAHSRFVAIDRAENDRQLTELLGPDASKRPESLVVVGTQVLEQSLDIDLDLLVTDVAPIDLLIQRIGRLHRHRRGVGESMRPRPLRTPRCLVTGVETSDNGVPEFSRGVDAVYEPAILMRTLLALRERMGTTGCLTLPDDIAPLVEAVYDGDIVIPTSWKAAYDEAYAKEMATHDRKIDSADQWLLAKPGKYSLCGWMRSHVAANDEVLGRAKVRDTEESIEVVVVCRRKDGYALLPWVSQRLGVEGSLGAGADVPDDETARAAALCTVNLPPALSASYAAQDVIDALERQGTFIGWQDSRWLRGALPLVVDDRGEAVITCRNGEYRVRYTQEAGLEVI